MEPRRARTLPAAFVTVSLLVASCGGDAADGEGTSRAADGPTGAASETDGSTFDIAGRWRGRLMQKGLEPFTVTATIRPPGEGPRSTVSYSGIDCGGTWSFMGESGGAYRFREVIDRGRGGTCKGVGTVTLTPEGGDRLSYVFRGGGVESRGTLRPVTE